MFKSWSNVDEMAAVGNISLDGRLELGTEWKIHRRPVNVNSFSRLCVFGHVEAGATYSVLLWEAGRRSRCDGLA